MPRSSGSGSTSSGWSPSAWSSAASPQFRDTDSFLFQGGFAVLALASCAAIAAAVHPGTTISRLLGLPFMVWVGKRSYSLYLWHWPIFVYTQPEIDTPLTLYPTLVLRLALTVAAAELSYRYVEVPIRNGAFRRWRQRLSRRHGARKRTGPIVLAASAGLILVAVNTVGATGTSSMDQLTGQGTIPPGATIMPIPTTTSAATPTSVAADPAATTPGGGDHHQRGGGRDDGPVERADHGRSVDDTDARRRHGHRAR